MIKISIHNEKYIENDIQAVVLLLNDIASEAYVHLPLVQEVKQMIDKVWVVSISYKYREATIKFMVATSRPLGLHILIAILGNITV